MQISKKGLDLIRSFEGYLRKLPDGSCIAYRCPAGVWTIGWGCTEGVKEGMRWTKAEAEEALRREIAKHEMAVTRLVTVDLNQNQYDALVSFSYNVGSGALGKSTLLKKLNRRDFAGAQAEFMKWNKAGGKQLRGLSRRRAAEAELFATRTEEEAEAVENEPVMPQDVDEPAEPMFTGKEKALAAAGTAGTVVPNVPSGMTRSLTNVESWTAMGRTAGRFASAAVATPLVALGVIGLMALIWFGPRIWERFTGDA